MSSHPVMARLAPTISVLVLLAFGGASADMLIMKGPDGETHVTNRGGKRGYRVVSRFKEFRGSSGLGLRGKLPVGRSADYDDAILAASKTEDLEPALVKAVIRAESAFNPQARSPKGAMGLMQLMPGTAAQWGVRNAYDPVDNIKGGTRHLRYLMDRYRGRTDFVLAAYNAGTVPVDRANGIPNYDETQEYVRRVRSFREHYVKNFNAGMPRIHAAGRDRSIAGELKLLKKKRPQDFYRKTIVLHGGNLRLK